MTEINVLKKRKDFVRVARQGQKMVSHTLILQAALSLSMPKDSCRIGFTVTKKIGKAHERNRTKRRLRAAVRECFAAHALPQADYVLIGRYSTAGSDFKDLCKDLQKSVSRINKLLLPKENVHDKAVQPLSDSNH